MKGTRTYSEIKPTGELKNFVHSVSYIYKNLTQTFLMKNKVEPGKSQPNNPLHGVKLVDILEELVAQYGWEKLAMKININCFKKDPSIKSSLKFLRKTPWARDKVEQLYLQKSY